MTKIKENKKKEIKSTGLTNIFQRRNRSSRRTDPYQRTTDGRQFRRTGRTIQFTTRVTPEYDELIRDIAYQENSLLVEILEKSLESYCREIN
jgi:hypothetical protein